MGACGLCLVRLESGDVGEPTPNERNYLNKDQLSQGIRLACQTKPEQDIKIAILAPAEESSWKVFREGSHDESKVYVSL